MFLDPRSRPIIAALWSALALTFAVHPASGQTPTAKEGAQALVNSYTTGDQLLPRVAVGSGGALVVVWETSDSFGESGSGVQARILDSQAQPVGADFRVNSYTTSLQLEADVAVDEEGEFVVVWTSYGADNGDSDSFSVQGQRFDSAGASLGSQFLVNSFTTNGQIDPAIAMADAGEFIVVWSSGTDIDPSIGIAGRLFASNGDPLGAQFGINSYTTNAQQAPDVAMDGGGDFVVSWQSFGSASTDTDDWSIQARLFASGGSPIGDQFQVNTYTPSAQIQASVAVDPAGDFVVVWTTYGAETGDPDPTSAQAQRFASDGTALGQQFLVNVYTTGSQSRSDLSMDRDGNFVVVWRSSSSDNGDSDSYSIQGRRFEKGGAPVGDQFPVNTYTTGSQSGPAVAVDQNGDFFVVWDSAESDNGDAELGSIQGQRFRATADVGDLVFRDENLDGLQTPGEPGVEGVPVHLYESGGDLLESTVTDATGGYLFRPKIALQGVADEFFVRYEAPAELQFTAANVGIDDTIDSDVEPVSGETDDFVVLSAGEDHTDRDAGLASGVGNRVWHDLDGNGLQDGGEPGAEGVLVEVFSGTNVLQASTTTSADGFYGFSGLETGTYYLAFTAPGGTTFTARDQGADDALDSDANPASGTTTSFVFSPGEIRTEWDAGLIANLSQIGDRAWLDADGNGVQDGGEDGVEGVTVHLYREPDPPLPNELATLVGADLTDSDGFYSFMVEPGTYYLELVCPADSFTLQNQGADDALDSDVNPATGTTSPFALALGAPDSTRDAGHLDGDADGVATCVDNCPSNPDPDQTDSDGDGSGDPCDLCAGDDAGGDADGDGLCAGSPYECDDMDPTNASSPIFDDGFESGDTSAWSITVN